MRSKVPPTECEKLASLIPDLVEGAGDEPAWAVEHLDTCPRCGEIFSGVRSLLSEIKSVPVPDPGPLYWRSLPRRVEEAKERRARRAWWRAAGAIAAALALAALSLMSAHRASAPPSPPSARKAVAGSPEGAVSSPDEDQVLDAFALLSDSRPLLGWELESNEYPGAGPAAQRPASAGRHASSGEEAWEATIETVSWSPWYDDRRDVQATIDALDRDEAARLVEMLREEMGSRATTGPGRSLG